jgi:hypothetical protein
MQLRRQGEYMYIGKQHVDGRGVDLKNAQTASACSASITSKPNILQRGDDNQADQFLVFGHKDENLVRQHWQSLRVAAPLRLCDQKGTKVYRATWWVGWNGM